MRTTPRPGRARRRGWGLKRREKQSREIGLKRREKQSREGNPKRREKQSREGNPKRREKQSRESRGGGGPARTRPRSPRAIRLAEPTVTTGGRGERASVSGPQNALAELKNTFTVSSEFYARRDALANKTAMAVRGHDKRDISTLGTFSPARPALAGWSAVQLDTGTEQTTRRRTECGIVAERRHAQSNSAQFPRTN